ncbi:predicted protein [Naegleria gruberi]|uniref:Predicted protein n=1 Tax=Naegleria gruberi TaxID=5762 RepID=D2VTF5_NAEGR|nr:uncharacterized protein NAEGRDRAFT_72281 [Naegleria gruberi]EFC39923.1 predicted protein [Naegleria gruberi]|eukprot:XP_002672667.1 predicted protein [Naegleria gruberi strain NEG-M]
MVESKLYQQNPIQDQLKPPLSTDLTAPSSFLESTANFPSSSEESPSREEWVFRDNRSLIHSNHELGSSVHSIVFQKAKDSYYWDVNNVQYLDMIGGLHTCHIGHGREEMAQVAYNQMKTMEFAPNIYNYSHSSAIKCAEKLVSITKHEYPSMERVYFTSGGSEAVEASIHLAERYWSLLNNSQTKKKIISFRNCYHGSTFVSSSLNEQVGKDEYGYQNLKGPTDRFSKDSIFLSIDFPHDFIVNSFQKHTQHANNGFFIAEQLENLIKLEGPENIAAFIAEPIQGVNGALEPHKDFFPLARRICDKYGVLLIADEVMTGFGKTGKWFGLSHYGIEPDIVVFGKGVTSGYLPLGGMMLARHLCQVLFKANIEHPFLHEFTFSGHPVCCEIVMKNLEIMFDENLVQRAAVMGTQLKSTLVQRLQGIPHFKEVSGMGFMLGLIFDEHVSAKRIHEELATCYHILVDYSRQNDRVVLITPPFNIHERDLNIFVDSIEQCVRNIVNTQQSTYH